MEATSATAKHAPLPFPETLMRKFASGFLEFVANCQNHYHMSGYNARLICFLMHKYEIDESWVQRAKNSVVNLYEWYFKPTGKQIPSSINTILTLRLMHFIGTAEGVNRTISGYNAEAIDFIDNTFTPWLEIETRVRMLMKQSDTFDKHKIMELIDHCDEHMSDEDIHVFGHIVFGTGMINNFKSTFLKELKEKNKDSSTPMRLMRGLSKYAGRMASAGYRKGTQNYVWDTIIYNDIDEFYERMNSARDITNSMVDTWVSACIKSERGGTSRAEFLRILMFQLHLGKKMYITNTSNLCHVVNESLAGVKCLKAHTTVPIKMIQEGCTDKETLDKLKEIIETFPHLLDTTMVYELSKLGYDVNVHDKYTKRVVYRDDTQSAKKARQTQ